MKFSNGFTLVELMIALTLSSLVVLVAASLILTARKQMLAGEHSTQLQQDLSLALELLQNELRPAKSQGTHLYADYSYLISGLPTNYGSCLQISQPDGKSVAVYQYGKALIVQRPNVTHTLIASGVDSLYFSRPSGIDSLKIIQVRLRLSNGNESLSTTQNFWLRN